tara:strand:- start:2508 stop:2756 length:249 start_codon:yes stop_codon:yes gene_type:complete
MPGMKRRNMGMGYKHGGSLDMKKMKMAGGGIAEDMKPVKKFMGGKFLETFSLPIMAAKYLKRKGRDEAVTPSVTDETNKDNV